MTDIKIPKLGESIEAAEIVAINVSEGDDVVEDQIILELETDKANVEVPCSDAGEVAEVLVSVGDEVQVGDVVMKLREGSESETEAESGGEDGASKEENGKKNGEPRRARRRDRASARQKSDDGKNGESRSGRRNGASAGSRRRDDDERQEARDKGRDDDEERQEARGKGRDDDDERQEARDKGRDDDEERQEARDKSQHDDDERQEARDKGQDDDDERQEARDKNRDDDEERGDADEEREEARGKGQDDEREEARARKAAEREAAEADADAGVERWKLSRIARSAAVRLARSWSEIPHVTHTDWADLTAIEELRSRMDSGVGLSAIFARVACVCLQEFPRFNASIDMDAEELIFKRRIGLGIAVDTDFGLLVPVVDDAARLGIRSLDQEIRSLARRARQGRISQEQLEGSTFTITNVGSIGGEFFTPIIPLPLVAILGIGRAQNRGDGLALPLSLSYDHRANNGADAARFLGRFAELLSNPLELACS